MFFRKKDRDVKRHTHILSGSFSLMLIFSCSGAAQVREVSIPVSRPPPATKPSQPFREVKPRESSGGGIAANIRFLCDKGSFSALREAITLIHEDNINESEFGRVMNAVAVTLLEKVYGDPGPAPDPPKNHAYSKILSEADRGIYREPPPSSGDYLENVLPFLALLESTAQSRFAAALPHLEKARQLNPNGTLAPYFLGFAAERTERWDEALNMYRTALLLAPDCYPAAFGVTRIMQNRGQNSEAIALLSDLAERYPDNIVVKQRLANAYFRESDWANAALVIDAALEKKPQDPSLSLMRARVLFENGQFVHTQAILDKFVAENPENRDYLLLRARLQNEGFRNRESAVNILRPLYKLNPGDFPIALYLARLLLESDNAAERTDGERMLLTLMRPLRTGEDIPISVIQLASEDAVRRGDWEEARKYQDRILEERRSPSALVNAFKVEQGLGNRSVEFDLAQELIQNYPNNEDGRIVYVEALIDSGRHGEALRLIDARVAVLGAGAYKSRYFYLRGTLRGEFDAAVSDFRSSLFENPRNIDALKALIGLYHRHRDERHAVYYLRQALAIAPRDPALLQYQKEYEGKM
ncbi:MAG: tetratricopeptide repeat protein [Spirochaetaceae bacterium]|jgi:tetratricopeptide (TPR) repeat protein|nr:tetratricopeptide repeat protein [Spirochaetaceae bacterium]